MINVTFSTLTFIFAKDAGDAADAMRAAGLTVDRVVYVVTTDQFDIYTDPAYLITTKFWDRPDAWSLFDALFKTQTHPINISGFPGSVQGLLTGSKAPYGKYGPGVCSLCGSSLMPDTKLCNFCNLKPTAPKPPKFKHIKEPPPEKLKFKKIRP